MSTTQDKDLLDQNNQPATQDQSEFVIGLTVHVNFQVPIKAKSAIEAEEQALEFTPGDLDYYSNCGYETYIDFVRER